MSVAHWLRNNILIYFIFLHRKMAEIKQALKDAKKAMKENNFEEVSKQCKVRECLISFGCFKSCQQHEIFSFLVLN